MSALKIVRWWRWTLTQDLSIEDFQYRSVVRKMCQINPENRFTSFLDVEREVLSNKLSEIEFFGQELSSYRAFANALTEHVAKIENGTKYTDDHEKIVAKLESAYRNFMLEVRHQTVLPYYGVF